MGEHTMIAAAPLVADAVEAAVGIRCTEMPITAERVALAAARREEPDKWAST
jgi:carbon-monoxide dehydrogenase large subunit